MKEVSKNKKLGLIIAIAAVVLLAVVGVVLALVLGGGQGAEEKFESKLYWNIDGKSMLSQETAMSTRKPAADGLYYIRYIVGGEIVEIPFADKKLVTKADRMEISCLKFDADGIAIELIDPEELYVRIQDKTYVQAVNGNTITTNTSTVLNGMKKQITLPEGMPIINVSTRTGELEIGQKVTELETFDQVLIYGTDEETITDIFLTDRYWDSEIYWRIGDRVHWDASRKVSTRPLAEDGYWYIDLACKGEVKTYKVAQQDCIDVLDSKGPTDAATGVVFDENGAIVNLFNAGLACRGTLQANSYDITDLSEDGKTFTATRVMFGTEIGKTFTGTITENTQIYNISATAEDHRGEPTTLQLNDRLQVFQAADGSIHTIFVVNRMVDSPFYYNLSRKWSSVNGLTRVPDEDGYYVYELAVNGKVKTVRTKDKAIAEQMDGANLSLFGLRLKGDIVTKVYEAVNVAGNWSFSTQNFVTTLDGGILGTVNTSGTAANGVMAADCKVYDVSQCYKEFRGEKTKLREGDQILAYQNAVGEVTHVWVLNRYVKGTTIYWNCNRYYANGETTRTPDADGYYVFNVIKAGTTKVIQLKTKDKEVANRFDKEGSTTAAALKVKGDIIQAAYPAPAAIGGYYRLAGFWVHELNVNDTPGTHALIAKTGAIGNIIMADDCKIMNFSSIIKKAAGEATQLKVGDFVWPIAGQDGKIHYIFIIEREVAGSKVAWRKGGTVAADENGDYIFTLWVNGKIGTYKTKDAEIANYINTRATGFAVSVKGELITGAYPISSEPNTKAASVSYYDYVKTENGVMTLKRNRIGQTDTGNEMTVTLADNYKAYNFDPASGDDWGKQVKLTKGDRVYAYQNNNNETFMFFIMYDCTLEGGNERYCDHCGKKVHWESLFAGFAPAAGCVPETAHYYLPKDYATNNIYALGHANLAVDGVYTEIVFDLNGKTMTRMTATGNGTTGLVKAAGGATVIVTDLSKGQTGKMVTVDDINFTSGQALLHVESGSKMIIEKGMFDASLAECSYTNAAAGAISVGGELIVNGGTIKGWTSKGNGGAIGAWGGSKITVNGGTIIGGTVNTSIPGTGYGGAIYTNGDLTINGGTIKGGNAAAGGDNIFFGRDLTLAINGGTIDGGIQVANANAKVILTGKPVVNEGKNYGLNAGKALIDATGLKKGASVTVDASGVFTTEFASEAAAQAVLDNGMLKNGAETMMLAVKGKAIEAKDDGLTHDWKDANSLPTMGNWRLVTDVTIAKSYTLTGDLYLDLNGHTVENTGAERALSTGANKLTVDDTSAEKNGVIKSTNTTPGAFKAGVIFVDAAGQYVQMAGTLDASAVSNTYTGANSGTLTLGNGGAGFGSAIINGGKILGYKSTGNGSAIGMMSKTTLVINGGEIIGNTLTGSGATGNGGTITAAGYLTINGGKIYGGKAGNSGDNIDMSHASATLTITGGEIDGGIASRAHTSLTITGNAKIGEGTTYGLKLNANQKVDMKGFTGEAYVDANGVFTTDFASSADAQALIDGQNVKLGKTKDQEKSEFKVNGNAIELGGKVSFDPTAWNEWNSANAAAYLESTEADLHKTNLPKSGKWKLIDNVTISATAKMTGNLELDLNNKVVTMTGNTYAIEVAGNTLTIDDKSSAGQGTIKTVPTANISQRASVIYVNASATAGKLILNGGIIDGSAVVNTLKTSFNGTITLGNASSAFSSMEMNGGVVKGQKNTGGVSDASGSAIGMMNGTTLVVNGGKIYGKEAASNKTGDAVSAAGTTISAGKNGSITINGGELYGTNATNHGGNIYTSGNLYINGGLISGGKAYHSGVICCAGAEMIVTGGTITGGQNDLAARGNVIDKGTGKLIIKDGTNGTFATIAGGIGIRGGAALELSGKAVIDQSQNVEKEGNIFIMSGQTGTIKVAGVAKTVTAGTKYSLKYKCYTIEDLIEGNENEINHNIQNGVCGDCGFTEGAWTGSTLPTAGTHTLATDLTVTSATVLTGDLTLNLNGHTVTRVIAESETANQFAINTNGYKLVINDASGKFGENLGKIVASAPENYKVTAKAGLIYVPTGSVTVNNGIIDGSNLVHQGAGYAGVITTDTGAITINGGIVKGMRNLGTASVSSGATSSDNAGNTLAATAASAKITVGGGQLIAPASTASNDYVSGAGACIISKAPVTITGGELIGTRVANHGGVVNISGNSLTMTGGVLKNGISTHSGLVNCAGTSSITGGVLIGGSATNNGGHGGENIDFNGTQLTIGGDAIIGGGIGIRGSAKLILTGKPIINDGMQAQARGDIRIKAGQTNAKVYLNDATGTPILTGASTETLKDVEYNADGTIKGLKAVAGAKTYTEGAFPTSGTVKLGADVNLTNAVATTGALVIDLNGHTITREYAGSGEKFAINAKHNLIITDTSAEGNGTIVTTVKSGITYGASTAGVIYSRDGAHVILAGGTIDGSAVVNTYNSALCGTITVGNDGAPCSFTMLGGTVKGQVSTAGTTGQGGGCIGGRNNTTITIYGGQLLANTEELEYVNYQGTCISTGGNVNVYGGEMVGGRGYSHGGTMYIGGNLNMTGGYIHGGSSNNSGNIMITGAKVSITGGVIMDGVFNKELTATNILGSSNLDICGTTAEAVIGGNAVIGGGVSVRNTGAKLTIKDQAVIDMNLQSHRHCDLRIRVAATGNGGLYLGNTKAATAVGFYKLTHDLAGNVASIVSAN